jgi:hypothetical protein
VPSFLKEVTPIDGLEDGDRIVVYGELVTVEDMKTVEEITRARFEPGDAPRIGFGHRKVHLL